MYVAPINIVAGLGALDRRSLCNMIAGLEAATLLSMATDRARDVSSALSRGDRKSEDASFPKRVQTLSDSLFDEATPDRALRIRLWTCMARALGIDDRLPLSTRKADKIASAAALRAAAVIASPSPDGATSSGPARKVLASLAAVRKPRHLDFSALVADHASQLAKALADAALAGDLPSGMASVLGQRVREHIMQMPEELRDDTMRAVVSSGDRAAFALLSTGAAALSVGVGVNIAGFSAYILAAQASAFIPLVSGPVAASTLFMLANPLFTVPALIGAGLIANSHLNATQSARIAAAMAVQLATRGLSARKDGTATALDDFRNATPEDLSASGKGTAGNCSKVDAVRQAFGGSAPRAPRVPELGPFDADARNRVSDVLFASRADAAEVASVAALSAADILFNAVLINPSVIAAADFSRIDDISDVFEFSTFADDIRSMGSKAAAGAANNLRGYVSEQLVAARLVEAGHIVSFPATSNNAGYDLLVDGMPFQVKCLLGIEGLRTHFAKYPDMPVYANAELADLVAGSDEAWSDLVFFVDGFEREVADLVMEMSLDAGASLGDINVPYFAMAVSTARNLHRIWRGRMSVADLPLSVAMDIGIKGGLSSIGAVSGKAIGLLAFGPAGALLMGGAGGVGALAATGWAKDRASSFLSSAWRDDLDTATERLRLAMLDSVRLKIALISQKRLAVPDTNPDVARWIGERFADEIIALEETAHEIAVAIPALGGLAKARACLLAMDDAGIHPRSVKPEFDVFREVISAEPAKMEQLTTKVSGVWSALKSRIPKHAKGD